LKITAVDTQISSDGKPVAAADTFPAGFNRIYFFVTYANLQSGVLWQRDLLYNDQVVQHVAYLWGTTSADGDAYFFFGQEGGFKVGKYEIRLYIGDTTTPATTYAFTVKQP
jgi:hypothetical protein